MDHLTYHEKFDDMAYVSHDISPFIEHLTQIGVISEYNKKFKDRGYHDVQSALMMNNIINKAMEHVFKNELDHHSAILYVRYLLDCALTSSCVSSLVNKDFDDMAIVPKNVNQFIHQLAQLGIIAEYSRLFTEKGYPDRQAGIIMNNIITASTDYIFANELNYFDAITYVRELLDNSLNRSDAAISHCTEYAYRKCMQLA